jgi:hypothetical protein
MFAPLTGCSPVAGREVNMIVLTKPDGTFVTTLNADLGNGWWNGATVVHGP